jgi:dynein heavy chain
VEDSAPNDMVAQFLEAKVVDGKRVDNLLFYAQDGTVICTMGDGEPLKGKGAFVVRVTDDNKPVSVPDNDINFGTINGSSAETLLTLTKLMSEVYDPCLASNLFGYMKKMKPAEKEELENLQKKCVVVIDKAIASLQSGLELAKVDPSDESLTIENKPAAIQAAATNPSVVSSLEGLVAEWCEQMEKLFNEAESPAGGNDEESSGPRSELEHWRNRMGKLNSVIEQLRGEQCRVVLAVLQVRHA